MEQSPILWTLLFSLSIPSGIAAAGGEGMIENGKKVSFMYTLTVDGKIVDTNLEKEPLSYVQGTGHIIPGLESKLIGMKPGDKKDVEVAAEDAYGPIDPKAFAEVPLDKLPEGAEPGMLLNVTGEEGQQMTAKIKEIQKGKAIVDFNHPLAGKSLFFHVEIVSVN